MRIKDDEGHLGGYVIGQKDPRTWCPLVWQWMSDTLRVRTVLDVGCGLGHAVECFHRNLIAALGLDGSESAIRDSVAPDYCGRHDFTTGAIEEDNRFDAVWSCEFVEHVHEDFLPNVLEAFRLATGYLLMTHATPGQGGHHHVNEQPREYWIDLLENNGFAFDDDLTTKARSLASKQPNDDGLYFRKTGLVFRRTDD